MQTAKEFSLANPDQYSSVTAENFVASATTHAGTFALQSCDALCAAGVETGTDYFLLLSNTTTALPARRNSVVAPLLICATLDCAHGDGQTLRV
jgi:hypothetical protein